MWRDRFGRYFLTIVRQTTGWIRFVLHSSLNQTPQFVGGGHTSSYVSKLWKRTERSFDDNFCGSVSVCCPLKPYFNSCDSHLAQHNTTMRFH
jgi:hypothetical protein